MPIAHQTADQIYRDVIERARQRDENKPERQPKRRIKQRPPMPTRDYTDQEWTELGRRMAANPKAITTNIEGKAYLDYTNEQKRQKIAKHGCCGDGPDEEGLCFGIGRCPRQAEAANCEAFAADFINWINQQNEYTALAAVAVRLSSDVPVIGEPTA